MGQIYVVMVWNDDSDEVQDGTNIDEPGWVALTGYVERRDAEAYARNCPPRFRAFVSSMDFEPGLNWHRGALRAAVGL